MEMNIEVKSVRLKEWWLDRIENDMKVAGVNKGVKGQSTMEVQDNGG